MAAIGDFLASIIHQAEVDVAVFVGDVETAFGKVETSAYAIVKTEAKAAFQAGMTDLGEIEQAIIQKYEADGGFPGLISKYGSPVLQAIIAAVRVAV